LIYKHLVRVNTLEDGEEVDIDMRQATHIAFDLKKAPDPQAAWEPQKRMAQPVSPKEFTIKAESGAAINEKLLFINDGAENSLMRAWVYPLDYALGSPESGIKLAGNQARAIETNPTALGTKKFNPERPSDIAERKPPKDSPWAASMYTFWLESGQLHRRNYFAMKNAANKPSSKNEGGFDIKGMCPMVDEKTTFMATFNVMYETGLMDDLDTPSPFNDQPEKFVTPVKIKLECSPVPTTQSCVPLNSQFPVLGGGCDGSSRGEPWLHMMDGQFFGFQAVGEFTLVIPTLGR
jgi:hypothetical protein